MNRFLLLVNLVLLVVLTTWLIRIERHETSRVLPDSNGAASAAIARLTDVTTKDGISLTIEFDQAMVADAETGRSPDAPLIEARPALEFEGRWRSSTRIDLVAKSGVRPATRYEIGLAAGVLTRMGRRVDLRGRTVVETPRVELESFALRQTRGRTGLALRFSQPVDPDAVAAQTRLEGEHGRLEVSVAPTPSFDRTTVLLDIVPGEKGLPSTANLVIAGTLRPIGGELQVGTAITRSIRFGESLRWSSVDADENDVFLGFNHVIEELDPATVKIDPAVPISVINRWGGVSLQGDLESGRTYVVTLEAGFPGRGDHRLEKETSRTIRINDREPTLSIVGGGEVLSQRARPEIRITGVNVSRIAVTIRTAIHSNLVLLGRRDDAPRELFASEVRKIISAPVGRNRRFEIPIDLAEISPGISIGVYEIEVADAEDPWIRAGKILQITDLSVRARVDGAMAAVHVQRLSSGIDVAGARVRLIDRKDRVLATATTDSVGKALVAWLASFDDAVPYAVEVTTDGDRTLIDAERFVVVPSEDELGGIVDGSLRALVSTERTAVRPGEPLRAAVLVRDDGARVPAGREIALEWISPKGRPVRTEKVRVAAAGLVAAELPTSSDVATGSWMLAVRDLATNEVIGSGRYTVEAFVPERLELEITPTGSWSMGSLGECAVAARWLDGTPAADLDFEIEARFDLDDVSVEGHDGHVFGASGAIPHGAVSPIGGHLDAAGHALIRFEIPRAGKGISGWRATMRGEVLDPSGRPVVATANITIPAERRLGVRATAESVDIVLIDRANDLVEGTFAAEVDLVKKTESWTWRTRDDGRSGLERREEAVVIETRAVRIVDGRASLVMTPPRANDGEWYVAVVRVDALETEAPFGALPTPRDRVRVIVPDSPVPAGSVARIAIESPLDGRAFCTLEGRGIHDVAVVDVIGGKAALDLRVPEGLDRPNLHVTVSVQSAQARRDAAAPYWLIGAAPIDVDFTRFRTSVAIEAPEVVAPQGRLEIGVHAPGATEAIVAVVDEGVLAVGKHRPVDPFAWLAARRRHASRLIETGASLVDAPRFAPEVIVGGGDDEGLDERLDGTVSEFIRCVALSDHLHLDGEGRGRSTLLLPPYEGRLRVVVLAVGPVIVGSAVQTVRVQGPITLMTAGPRFLAPGDESRCTVVVGNNSSEKRQIALSIETNGIDLMTADQHDIDLEPMQRIEMALPVRSAGSGVASVRAIARSGADVLESTFEVLVRPASRRAVVVHGVEGSNEAIVRVPDDFVGQDVEVGVRFFGSADARLLPLLESLIAYPYGCAEQTTSRCVALLAARPFQSLFHPDGGGPPVDDMLSLGIDRLATMQTHEGGLAFWPEGREVSAYGSIHAAEFLVAAKEAGVAIDAVDLDRLLTSIDRGAAHATDPLRRTLAFHVLSRAGRPSRIDLDEIVERACSREERALAAMALERRGRLDEAKVLLDGAVDDDRPRQTGGFLVSDLRGLAREVEARLLVDPSHPALAGAVLRLERAALRADRLTTNEAAHVLGALARVAARRGGASCATDVRLEGRGQPSTFDIGRRRTIDVRPGEELRFEGKGSIFGVLDVRGHKVDDVRRDELGLRLSRRIVDAQSGEFATTMRRGRTYRVLIDGESPGVLENLAVSDLLPSGIEIERRSVVVHESESDETPVVVADRTERRDDRILFLIDRLPAGRFRLVYEVRAVVPGRYTQPALVVESLYEPGRESVVPAAAGAVTIEEWRR